jgi:hypothetical protein
MGIVRRDRLIAWSIRHRRREELDRRSQMQKGEKTLDGDRRKGGKRIESTVKHVARSGRSASASDTFE